MGISEGLLLIAALLGMVLFIAWIFLPFGVMGTNSLLEDLIAETRKTNALLKQRISNETASASDAPTAPSAMDRGQCPNCDAVIPMNSSECPKCKAQFGPGSAWEVKPL